MMSPIWPSPPAVDDGRQRRQRLLGRRDRSRTCPTGWSLPGSSRPAGDCPIGGSRARCMDPSRLVWPTVATALAGTTTSGFTDTSTSALPVTDGHLADTADDDVVDHHGRIRFQRADIGELDVVDGRARSSPHRTRQRQRVPALKRASAEHQCGRRCQPPEQEPAIAPRVIMAALRRVTACPVARSAWARALRETTRATAQPVGDLARTGPAPPPAAGRTRVEAVRRCHPCRPIPTSGVSGGPGLGPAPPGARFGSE